MYKYQKKILQTIVLLFISVVLYLTNIYDYLLFNRVAELFSIIISFTIFTLAWNSRNFSKQDFDYLIFIGIAYMFVSVLDLLHVLSYNGINIFKGYDFYATQLWIGARFLESISLLVPFIFMHFKKHLSPYLTFTIYTIITLTIIASIFCFKVFPIYFIVEKGQTQFKIISEYIICLVLIADAILLRKNKNNFDNKVYKYLLWSIIFAIISEFQFTLYISTNGFLNLLGYYFKIISFYCIYRAVVITCITKPYQTISKELTDKEKVINDQKDELIRMQEKQLEAIIENMSDGLFTIDRNYKIILLNNSAKEFFWDSNSLDIRHPATKYYNSEGKLFNGENIPISKVYNGGRLKDYTISCHRPDGIFHFSISASPVFDKNGDVDRIMISSRNQTKTVNNNEIIKIQNKQLETIIENMYENLIIFDRDETIIKFNNQAKVNNVHYKEIKKMSDYLKYFEISDLEGNLLLGEKRIGTRILKGEKISQEKVIFKYNNKLSYIELNTNSIYDSKGNFMVCVLIARDITEDIKYKNKIEETLKIQDEIFANVSHELKTPLNVIFSANQLMELYSKSDLLEFNKEKLYEGINIIKQNCYRFTKLINNIVDISKMDSGFFKLNLSNENIVYIVEEIVQSVSSYINAKGINIIFDTNVEDKIITFDPEKIERIILNLISNAIKFTNPSGMIFVNLFDTGDTVEIYVKDTGIGMDKKHLNNIFKRFHQIDKSLSRNAEGAGIGLALVKSLVEMHEGKISVYSEVGKGSTFKIELPAKIIKDIEVIDIVKPINNKIEMIKIEFSDIYSI